MSLVQLRNVTNAPGRGPARVLLVGGISLLPGKAHTVPFSSLDKYTLRYIEACAGLVYVGDEPAPVPVAAAPAPPAPEPAPAPPAPAAVVEEVEEADVSFGGLLAELKYSSLVELHDLVSDEPYTGKRSKAAVITALLELDEGDVLAALE